MEMRVNLMETGKLRKMIKKVEDMLAAVSFAEEGESETARSLMKDGRRVLLALKQGRIDPATVKYAVNTSKRIRAELDILYIGSQEKSEVEDPGLVELRSALSCEGIKYRLIRKTGCLKKAVIDYTNTEKEILFAVVESVNSVDADCSTKEEARISELWQKLKCPLVVVMDEAGA